MQSPPMLQTRVIVALSGTPDTEYVLRRAMHIAQSNKANLIGVYVKLADETGADAPAWLDGPRRVLTEFGGRYVELAGTDVAESVLKFARTESATHLVLGATRRSRPLSWLHSSTANVVLHSVHQIEVHVVPVQHSERLEPAQGVPAPSPRQAHLPKMRSRAAWVLAPVIPLVLCFGLLPAHGSIGLGGVLACNLIGVVAVALLGGLRPALLATAVAFIVANFLYAGPYYDLHGRAAVNFVGLVAFLAVGIAIGGLLNLETWHRLRVAWAIAQAENLARLAAESVIKSSDPAEALGSIRQTFDLDSVNLLRWDGVWRVEAAVGTVTWASPDEAPCSVEIADGRVLAMAGPPVADKRSVAFHAFVDQLRSARQGARLATIEGAPAIEGVPKN